MEETVFTPALEGISAIKSKEGEMLTTPFLDACRHILPVIEKFGPAMVLVKSDIGGNEIGIYIFFQPIQIQLSVQFGTSRGGNYNCKNIIQLYQRTSLADKIALKLAPDRKKFMEVIGGADDVKADVEKFCTAFSPLLEQNHKFLGRFGLDDLKAS